MPTEAIISTHQLSLGYQHRTILSEVTLEIHKGEFVGILGANGSGKSTFLRALLGLVPVRHGKICVLGETPFRGNEKIGYMPQARNYVAAANLNSRAILEAALDGTRYGLPLLSKHKKNLVSQVLEKVSATSYAHRPLASLSGGERQRIFLAQALLGNPEILLLDEPLANLDLHYQTEFVNLLADIQKNSHVTILLTEHDANVLVGVMNRVLYFANAKAVIGPVDEVITSETLTTLYNTPIEVVRFKERLFVIGDKFSAKGHHA